MTAVRGDPSHPNLTWQDFLELSAALAGLARVRSRFISLGGNGSSRRDKSAPGGDDPSRHYAERTLALARAGLYNFLSTAFSEPPSAAFVENLIRSGALAVLTGKAPDGDDLRRWSEGRSPHEHASELAAAYTQLLTRPGPRYVPPTASHYLGSGTGPAQTLSWGPAAEAAEAAYREAGLVVGGEGPCTPDHLAVELQFMQHCAAREAAAWGEGDPEAAGQWRERQSAFLASHLLPWASAFGDRVMAAGAHPYYRALARLTSVFLAAAAQALTETREASAVDEAPVIGLASQLT